VFVGSAGGVAERQAPYGPRVVQRQLQRGHSPARDAMTSTGSPNRSRSAVAYVHGQAGTLPEAGQEHQRRPLAGG
jgi:hypothetical protein